MYKRSFILALIAASALSCQKDSTPLAYPGEESLHISLIPQTGCLTKSPIPGTVFPGDRTIALSAYHNQASGTGKNYFSGIVFSKMGNVWKADKYWPSDGTLDFLAFSADGLSTSSVYSGNVSSGVTLTVPDNSIVQSDILWGYKAGQRGGSVTGISFRHAEAAVVFNAKAATPYDAAANTGITITGITVNSIKCSGTVHLPNSALCSWSSLGTAKDIPLPGLSSGYAVPSSAIDMNSNPLGIGAKGLVVIPQPATSVTLTYTAHNGRDAGGNPINSAGLQATSQLSGNWEAGKKYVYTFDFKDNVSFDANVFEWTLDGAGLPVAKIPSATFSIIGESSVSLPELTLSAGGSVGIDWGDGNVENKSSASERSIVFHHDYASSFTGTVLINVLRGSIDFGTVQPRVFNKFAVNETDKVSILNYGKRVLSMMDINGNDTALQNTANCYIVRESDEYLLPCVYGNGIKNGKINAAAYTNIGGPGCADFVNHLGNVVTSPYINDNPGCAIASAELIWQTGTHLISGVSLENKNGVEWLSFYSEEIPDENGLALLAVKDASGAIMWSWMIWLTNDALEAETFTNLEYDSFQLLNENLGAIWNVNRTKFTGPFFQWGRKDPMPPLNDDKTGLCTLYDISGNVYSGYGNLGTYDDESSEKTVANAIRNPNLFFTAYGDTYYKNAPWNNVGKISNFWNASIYVEDSRVGFGIDTAIKTIYDPCPAGWMLPPAKAFTGFTSSNIIGSFDDGYTFKRNADDSSGSYFPSGYMNSYGSVPSQSPSTSYYWTYASAAGSSYADVNTRGITMFASKGGTPNPAYLTYASLGCSIRPCKEKD